MPLVFCIGFNVLLFSLLDGILLQPLPYPDADRLVTLWETVPNRPDAPSTVTPADFLSWRADTASYTAMAAFHEVRTEVGVAGRPPENLSVAKVTPDFFTVLGQRPLLGELDLPGARGKAWRAVLSHEYWQRRFAGDPDLLGAGLRIDGETFEVAAILRPGHGYPEGTSLWLAGELPPEVRTDRESHYLRILARLRPDVGPASARAELEGVMARLAEDHPRTHRERRAILIPLKDHVLGPARTPLLILMVAGATLLLLTGFNQANLLLARAATKSREAAMRVALGAGRGRIFSSWLRWFLPLVAAGAVLGIGLAYLCLPLLVSIVPFHVPRIGNVAIDGRAALFGLFLAAGSGLLLALVPAAATLRREPSRVLRSAPGSASATLGQRRVRHAVAALQVCLSLVLLVGGGLMTASVGALLAVDLGFEPENRVVASLSLPADRYTEDLRRISAVDGILERIGDLPGVSGAAASTTLPLDGSTVRFQYRPVAAAEAGGGAEVPVAGFDVVTPSFFERLGIEVLEGREFSPEDRTDAAPVVVINRSLARRHWPEGGAVGRSLTVEWGDLAPIEPRRIVGVVEDVRQEDLQNQPQPALYLPYAQFPVRALALVVETRSDPATVVDSVRRALQDFDPQLAISKATTLQGVVERSISRERFIGLFLLAFASVGTVIASGGMYGAMAYSVAQRRREMGIRLAVGADRASIVRLILGEAAVLAGTGAAGGIAASLLLGRGLRSLLYGISPSQPEVFLAALGLVLAVTLLASALPAYRSAQVPPAEVLAG